MKYVLPIVVTATITFFVTQATDNTQQDQKHAKQILELTRQLSEISATRANLQIVLEQLRASSLIELKRKLALIEKLLGKPQESTSPPGSIQGATLPPDLFESRSRGKRH